MGTVNTADIRVSLGSARELHFADLDHVVAEIDRIASADREGRLRQLGNWNAGTIFNPLATWIDYSFEGFPPKLNPPWIIRFILKFQRSKFLKGPMPRGVKIPGIEGGTLATEAAPPEEGMRHLRSSLECLKREKPTQPSVLVGKMTHEEWIMGTLCHAELHMSYLTY